MIPLPECAGLVGHEGGYSREPWVSDEPAYTADQMREYGDKCAAAEREPAKVVFRALLLAAWDAPGSRTAGELRAAATTLFGAEAVDAAIWSMMKEQP